VQRRPGSFSLSSCGGTCIFGLFTLSSEQSILGSVSHQWLCNNISVLVSQDEEDVDASRSTLIGGRKNLLQRLSPAKGLSGAHPMNDPSHRRHCGHRTLQQFITSILEAVSCKSRLHTPSRVGTVVQRQVAHVAHVLSWDARPTLTCFNNPSGPAAYSRGTRRCSSRPLTLASSRRHLTLHQAWQVNPKDLSESQRTCHVQTRRRSLLRYLTRPTV
jgi:hypothetical protein